MLSQVPDTGAAAHLQTLARCIIHMFSLKMRSRDHLRRRCRAVDMEVWFLSRSSASRGSMLLGRSRSCVRW